MNRDIKTYIDNMTFLQLPLVVMGLLQDKKLKPIDLLVYSTLLNRTKLSIANGWVDDKGYYIKYEQEQLAKDLGTTRPTIKGSLERLIKLELLVVVSQAKNKCDLLYVMPCKETLHDKKIYKDSPNVSCKETLHDKKIYKVEDKNWENIPCKETLHHSCKKTLHDKKISFLEKNNYNIINYTTTEPSVSQIDKSNPYYDYLNGGWMNE